MMEDFSPQAIPDNVDLSELLARLPYKPYPPGYGPVQIELPSKVSRKKHKARRKMAKASRKANKKKAA